MEAQLIGVKVDGKVFTPQQLRPFKLILRQHRFATFLRFFANVSEKFFFLKYGIASPYCELSTLFKVVICQMLIIIVLSKELNCRLHNASKENMHQFKNVKKVKKQLRNSLKNVVTSFQSPWLYPVVNNVFLRVSQKLYLQGGKKLEYVDKHIGAYIEQRSNFISSAHADSTSSVNSFT